MNVGRSGGVESPASLLLSTLKQCEGIKKTSPVPFLIPFLLTMANGFEKYSTATRPLKADELRS